MVRTIQTLDSAHHGELRTDVAAVFQRYNRATDGTLILEGAYLQSVATRQW